MITTASITKIEPQCIGAFINQDRYQELAQNFNHNFPGEVNQVTLSKSALKSVLHDATVSGIKFMNGLENANDPSSRMLVLIPGNYTSIGSLPNSIIKTDGFLTNEGNNISLEKTWQVLFNHVLNFKRIDASANYTRINRGSFMGREILTELVNQAESDNLIYHFGYDVENNYPYKALIQSGINGSLIGDESYPCPGSEGCPKGTMEEMCALTRITTNLAGGEAEGQLNVLRAFRDKLLQEKFSGVEIEKYYTISASLLEAIDKEQNQQVIFKGLYDKYIKTSLNSLAHNDEETAYTLFQEALEHLTKTYLYQ
jgi:hypothetical protein